MIDPAKEIRDETTGGARRFLCCSLSANADLSLKSARPRTMFWWPIKSNVIEADEAKTST
jgi:hypothetical protein